MMCCVTRHDVGSTPIGEDLDCCRVFGCSTMPPRKRPSESQVRAAIIRSCQEWGVDVHQGSRNYHHHAAFRERALREATKWVTAPDKQDDEVQCTDTEIPRDPIEAVAFCFQVEFQDYTVGGKDIELRVPNYQTYDALDDHCVTAEQRERVHGSAPYYIPTNGGDEPVLYRDFVKFKKSQLDPFRRFDGPDNYRIQSMPHHAYATAVAEKGWLEETASEALVACHAVHKVVCYHCKRPKSLMWCGGASTSWKDMLCRRCGSCYEIKSKASKEAIEKIYRFGGTLRGGSFRRWCTDEIPKDREGKDYVVIMSRTRSFLRGGKRGWYVEIAEISHVVPSLTFQNFKGTTLKQSEDLRFRTYIHIKASTRSPWFTMPALTNKALDLTSLAKTSFDKVFPGRWDVVTGVAAPVASKAPANCKANNNTKKDTKQDLDNLRKELEKLKTGDSDDDWETAYE